MLVRAYFRVLTAQASYYRFLPDSEFVCGREAARDNSKVSFEAPAALLTSGFEPTTNIILVGTASSWMDLPPVY